jgi:hypothetical protein
VPATSGYWVEMAKKPFRHSVIAITLAGPFARLAVLLSR